MLELRIISPQENGFVQEIEWNNEELKTAIAKKMEDYKGLVFTEETIADGKKDRADLNKLRGAIDNERKRIKKMCMEPYDKFEKEVKEVLGLVDEQINAIDVQIKEVEQIKREEKRKTVQELFESIGFQKFVTLEMIWDEKWLNASVSLSKVENQMKETMYRIGEDVGTIIRLPEFSFEAMEVYKKTLNLSQAIQKGQELADIQKRKEEAERLKKEQEVVQTSVAADQPAPAEATAVVEEEPQRDWIGFRAYLSREDALALKESTWKSEQDRKVLFLYHENKERTHMIKFLSENWALLSFVVSTIAYIYYQVIAMRKGIRALLRADLIRLYNKYHDDHGYCPLYVKQSLEDEYKQYHTLKGNGVGTQMYNALMALPTEPPEREE